MRKFKLLKDLPGVKSGTIYEDLHQEILINNKHEVYIYPANHPEWFEEIKEDEEFSKQHRAAILDYIDSKGEKLTPVFGSKVCMKCGAIGPHYCGSERKPKKTVRHWLWEVFNDHFAEYVQYGGFRTEEEAEKFFACLVFRKYKQNGQEVWQDFEE